MMKKFIASTLIAIASCFMLTACDEAPDRVELVVNDTSRFQYIGQDSITQNGEGFAGDVIQYYVDNETYIVDLRRNKNPWSAKEGKDHETYDDIDYFATYNTITKNVCLFDLKLFNQTSVTLRINKPQVILKTMKFEEDYLIERVLK